MRGKNWVSGTRLGLLLKSMGGRRTKQRVGSQGDAGMEPHMLVYANQTRQPSDATMCVRECELQRL